MAAQMEKEEGISQLVAGIIQDGQELIRQQLNLFSTELKADLTRTKNASIPLLSGIGVAAAGILLLLVMVSLWIPWQWPKLPMWAGFAITGGLLLVVGGVLFYMGKAQFDQFNPLPDKTVQGLQENIQWTTKKT